MWGGFFQPSDPVNDEEGGLPGSGGGGGGDPFANSPYGPGYGFGETITVHGDDPSKDPFNDPFFNLPRDYRPGDAPTYLPNRPGGGGLLPDNPGYMPPSGQTIPNGPGAPQGSIDIHNPTFWEKFKNWAKEEWDLLKHMHLSFGGGGLGKLLDLFMKGYTGYELYKAINEDPDTPTTTPPGGGGKKGGGGGGGGGKFPLPSTPPVYQGLDYKPQFLAWQPTNAGAPQFTSGGPSSLRGTPPAPPPPPVKKKKKKGA